MGSLTVTPVSIGPGAATMPPQAAGPVASANAAARRRLDDLASARMILASIAGREAQAATLRAAGVPLLQRLEAGFVGAVCGFGGGGFLGLTAGALTTVWNGYRDDANLWLALIVAGAGTALGAYEGFKSAQPRGLPSVAPTESERSAMLDLIVRWANPVTENLPAPWRSTFRGFGYHGHDLLVARFTTGNVPSTSAAEAEFRSALENVLPPELAAVYRKLGDHLFRSL